jgi:hypothetical protein
MHTFHHRWSWSLLLTLCIALWATPTLAATIIVDADCTLTDAILSANLDSEIPSSTCEVGNGDDLVVLENGATYAFSQAYVMRDFGDISALPDITSTMTISGNGATVQRSPELNPCIPASGFIFDHDSEMFRLIEVGTEGNLTLHNVIIENGCGVDGGGINNHGTLTIIDSTIRTNTTLSYDDTVSGGGGIHNNGGNVTLINSHIVSNTTLAAPATYFFSGGGGVGNFGGTVNVINSSIVANHVEATNGGGGISNLGGSVLITQSHIVSNTTAFDGNGGGILSAFISTYPGKSTLHINESYILSNTAMGSGGGIHNVDTFLTVNRSQLVANRAENNGGGLSTSYSSTVTLVNTEVVMNSAGQRGGGIFSRESTVTITGASLADNTAGNSGGALYQALPREDDEDENYPDGSTRLTQSRIIGNSAVALYSEGETIDTVDNWWGHPDGPSGEGDGDGDSISNYILFEPYKTEDFPINVPGGFHQLLPYLAKE